MGYPVPLGFLSLLVQEDSGVNLAEILGNAGTDPEGLVGGEKLCVGRGYSFPTGRRVWVSPQKMIFHSQCRVLMNSERHFLSVLSPEKFEFSA